MRIKTEFADRGVELVQVRFPDLTGLFRQQFSL